MDMAQSVGPSGREAVYHISDGEMASGSTLGGPKVCMVIKATGAIEKVFSVEQGETMFGALVLRHWDEHNGMYLRPQPGAFIIHPEHQERIYSLVNGVSVHETLFALSGQEGEKLPPAVYYRVEMTNESQTEAHIATYAFCQLAGDPEQDVSATYDRHINAIVAWNPKDTKHVRVFGSSERPASYEISQDNAKAVAESMPGQLSHAKVTAQRDPLGILQHSHIIKPGKRVAFSYLLTFASSREAAAKTYGACPAADEALNQTKAYYHNMLQRSVVLTPNPQINLGVLWAKANMLRIMLHAPTGWCFTNDPGNSNNSVARDTAWFGFGADYFAPDFVRDSLLAFVQRQEPHGEIIEYYDIRTGKTADYGLNINDNTPLLILALWHHYNATGDKQFLQQVYPAAVKAGRYILSQRGQHGLVWCSATGTSDWGIVGWRNVIANYRLSGATTEVNSECYAALNTLAQMAATMRQQDDASEFHEAASTLRKVINQHLYNPENGCYYLNIDIDGHPHSDVTSDLVFPVMFGVASDETAMRIVRRLSAPDFWTTGGIRVLPRDAPMYHPKHGYGLLGGVWVAATFWYAFAAATFMPEFMDRALSTSFHNYSRNPRQNNTVPGQFSEWLNGETLANEGMMLSPWFPPRYLWAAIEGTTGFSAEDGRIRLHPRPAPTWKWMGVHHLPHHGQYLTWLTVRVPHTHVYTNFPCDEPNDASVYTEDISDQVHAAGNDAVVLGLRREREWLLFVGNTSEDTLTTAVHMDCPPGGTLRRRVYDSLRGDWHDEDVVTAQQLGDGITLQIESKGFTLLELIEEAE